MLPGVHQMGGGRSKNPAGAFAADLQNLLILISRGQTSTKRNITYIVRKGHFRIY